MRSKTEEYKTMLRDIQVGGTFEYLNVIYMVIENYALRNINSKPHRSTKTAVALTGFNTGHIITFVSDETLVRCVNSKVYIEE